LDAEKKRKLEELKKQIDPAVLAKMADYMGADSGGSAVESSSGSFPSGSGEGGSGLGDKMKNRRASQFQERMARKKQESIIQDGNSSTKSDKPNRKLYVLSHNDIWSRIVVSQFKLFDYYYSEVFNDFASLVRSLLHDKAEKQDAECSIAVSLKMLNIFLPSWQKLKQNMEVQGKGEILKRVHYFLAVESIKILPDKVLDILGQAKIICLTDEIEDNKMKIKTIVGGSDSSNKETNDV